MTNTFAIEDLVSTQLKTNIQELCSLNYLLNLPLLHTLKILKLLIPESVSITFPSH